MASPEPIRAPIPVSPQQPYAVTQEAGISWGSYNINTDAITNYYNMLGNMMKDGISLWENQKQLQEKRLQWEFEKDQNILKGKQASISALQTRGDHYFEPNYSPFSLSNYRPYRSD